jgi:hypothetical protein
LNDIGSVLRECNRILTNDGVLEIRVPYKIQSSNPFHIHIFDEYSLDYFIYPYCGNTLGYQQEILFEEVEPVKINRIIFFRSRLLRRLKKSYAVGSYSFKKWLGIDVNKNRTFGNRKEIIWKLKKYNKSKN